VKKIIILIIIFFAFYKTATYISDKMDQEFFDGYYVELQDIADEEDNEPSFIDKVAIFFEQLFEDKEEKFIYR